MLAKQLTPKELDAFWRSVSQQLHAFVRRRVRDADLAADLVQETLLRAQRHRGSAPQDHLEAWLYRIARNLVIDHYRKTQAQRSVSLIAVPAHEVEDTSALTQVGGCVQPMLARLSDNERQALEQTDLGDKTQAEFARAVGLSLAGAKSRVQRARAQLGVAIQRCCTPEVDATGTMIDHGCNCQPPHYCRDKKGRCGAP